jgi:hypothetical protein
MDGGLVLVVVAVAARELNERLLALETRALHFALLLGDGRLDVLVLHVGPEHVDRAADEEDDAQENRAEDAEDDPEPRAFGRCHQDSRQAVWPALRWQA